MGITPVLLSYIFPYTPLSVGFCLIQCLVALTHQAFEIVFAIPKIFRNEAYARIEGRKLHRGSKGILQSFEQRFDLRDKLSALVIPRGYDEELIAAKSCDKIIVKDRSHDSGCFYKRLVTHGMAVFIIDLLEVVKINAYHGNDRLFLYGIKE